MKRNAWIWGIIAGAGAGAATMYFLDPDRGSRRRALVRDKFMKANRQISRAVTGMSHDLANRGYGVLVQTKHLIKGDLWDASDEVICERVRSKMGRVVSNPHGINVACENGNVTLSGAVLSSEVQSLLSCVEGVAGVCSVKTMLDERQTLDEPAREQMHAARGGTKYNRGSGAAGNTPDTIH